MFISDKELLKNFYSGNRVWQLVPGIERTAGGRLFCTFYSGMTSETCGNYCVILQSDDDGESWSEPVFGAYDGQMNRCFDPVLWIDPLGRMWFTWARGHRYGLYGVICEDPDADELSWSEEFYIGEGVMMNKPVVLSTGEWLFPVALWDYWFTEDTFNQVKRYGDLYLEEYLEKQQAYSGANVYKTVDNGKTFNMIGGCRQINSRSHDEHMIYEKKNGVLEMLIRTKYGIGHSYSYDKGITWTVAEDSGLNGPASRFHIRRLKSGRLLLINHYNFVGRNNLTAFLSEDDGMTWPYSLLLDERKDVSYPDAAEGENGDLYIIYDRDRGGYRTSLEEAKACAREILMAKINEKDILNGSLCESGSCLKKIVSKLGEYTGMEDLYAGLPRIAPEEFIDTVMAYEDKEKILEAVCVYYPVNCQNMHCVDLKKLDELMTEVKAAFCDDQLLRKSLAALTGFLNQCQLSADRTRVEPLVNATVAYLQENVANDIDVCEFAQKNQISMYYLCHLFRKKTGMSIYEYRNACRFAKAKRLLTDTELKITDVSAACGFVDPSYFSRKFRETERISPREYRKRNRKRNLQ